MIKTRKILVVLLPAILVASLAMFIRIIQYQTNVLEKDLNKTTLQDGSSIQIPIYSDDPIIGDKKSPKTLIVFGDFGCESCQTQSKIMEQIQSEYPKKIKIIWKGLPITQFPEPTNLAHEYAFCLNKQKKFEEFSKLAFTNGQNLTENNLKAIVKNLDISQSKLDDCLVKKEALDYIQKNKILSSALNIQAVPAMFLNNKQISPPTDIDGWKAILGL